MTLNNLLASIKELLHHHPLDEKLLVNRKKWIIFGVIFIIVWQSFYYFISIVDILDFKCVYHKTTQCHEQKAVSLKECVFSNLFKCIKPKEEHFIRRIYAGYRRNDATGFNYWHGQKFVYFYYYLGLFPLTTTEPDSLLDYSKEGAEKLIQEKPLTLRTEWEHWARFGESARIWLFMPYAIITGSAKNPNIIFTNYLLFTFSLILLYLMFWIIKKPLLGILLVLILGNAPFMMYEIYFNNNVFGLMAVYAVMLFIIHVGYLFGYFKRYYIIMPLLSGIIFGVMNHIRVEALSMIISCILLYMFYFRIKLYQRLVLVVLLIGMHSIISYAIKEYFDKKREKTEQIVLKYGGVPFNGGRTVVHPLWHSLLCGLGDYGKKYGFIWHDTVIYNRILPILRKETGLPLKFPGKNIYVMGEYYDSLGWYYKKPENIKGYDSIAKKMFISYVLNDPLWYMTILIKRTGMFFIDLAPLSMIILPIPIPFSGFLIGLLVILLILGLLYLKEIKWLVFVLFTMPLGLSIILVYSGDHHTYQSVYHYFGAALILYIIVGLLFRKYKMVPTDDTFKT